MKILVQIAALFMFFVSPGSFCAAQVISGPSGPVAVKADRSVGRAQISYNKGRNETLVRTTPLRIQSVKPLDLIMQAQFNVSGEKVVEPKSVFLTFSILTRDKAYADRRAFRVYLDGEQVYFARARLISANQDFVGVTYINLSQELPYNIFLRIIAATKIKVQLGETEFELGKSELEALKDVKKAVQV